MSLIPCNKPPQSMWTFAHARIAPPLSGRRVPEALTGDLVAENRFYGTTMPADIPQEQLRTLEPGQWLTADLCSFYCNEVGNVYLEGAPGRAKDLVVLHSRTWDLAHWTGGSPSKVRCQGATHVLEHNDLLYDLNPDGPIRTVVLILNSLDPLKPYDPEQKVQNILLRLAEGRPLREEKLHEINVYQPLMPQQPNYCDCGLYPGFFLSVFLEAPEVYTAHCLGTALIDGPIDKVWYHDRIKSSRTWLKTLVLTSAEIRQAALDFNTDLPPPIVM
ncbi:hypothetical protein M407DRAFT_22496 [Tulasnella calospora MUT 4182]|uniref:Ubiquitin-like protease family profile domain-containing protein n=1 Tax=Tulasnella calospora MUT 4182 TaxID=1051891 RepID=A0A0C3M3P3_9AGAM|nr:hypothetical protein M407DRAFT_22496 [Tulasnella calospora MUT 4182]